MSVQTCVVTEDEADIRLDRFFRRRFPTVTQGVIQKWCRTGQVRIDGQRAEAATRLHAGQAVRVPPVPDRPEPKARQTIHVDERTRDLLENAVLYMDEHLMVLNKPYGLPVQGGPGIVRHLDGMLDALRFGAGRPLLVHRLDRDTTGVLVLARTRTAAARLAASFRTREAEKTYWAVVAGRPVPVEGRIDLPLTRVAGARGERTEPAGRDDAEAARAITDFRTLDHAARKLAWLELQPLTGRTHQLRVHCVAIGAPILGDEKYAMPDHNGAGGAFIEGLRGEMHLHARALRVPHPAGGMLTVEAPLPEHIAETFATLGFDAPAARVAERR